MNVRQSNRWEIAFMKRINAMNWSMSQEDDQRAGLVIRDSIRLRLLAI